MNIYQKLIELVKEQSLDSTEDVEKHTVSEIRIKAMFEGLGLDSLDHVELVMAVEEDFGLELNDDVLERYFEHETIGNFVSFIVSEMLRNRIFAPAGPMTRKEIAGVVGVPEDDVKLEERKCIVTLGTTKDAINVTIEPS